MEAISAHAEARMRAGEALLSDTQGNLERCIAAVIELREAKIRAMAEYEFHMLQHRAFDEAEVAAV